MNLVCKKDILLNLLENFFKKNNNYLEEYLSIYYGRSNISLRVIDWFVTNYSKNNNIHYVVNIMDIAYRNNYKIVLATSQK